MPVDFQIPISTLFFKDSETEETYKLDNIIDMTCTCDNTEYSEEPIMLIPESYESAFTFTSIINKMMIRYISGLPVPNNWKKMHNIPMKRKRATKQN